MTTTHNPTSTPDFTRYGDILHTLLAKVDNLNTQYSQLAERLNGSAAASVAPAKPDNRLIHGDCIDVMKTLAPASVDLIVTDPPYLVRYESRDGRTVPNDDNDRWMNPAFAEMFRVLKDNSFCISFYGWQKVDRFMEAWKRAGFRPVGHFTFVKRYASSQSFTSACHESAYLLIKGNPPKPQTALGDVLPWRYTGNKLHPTQKPVEALTPLIDAYSKPGDIVLDPFGGSGSTAFAAAKQGRRFLTIEKDPKYHAIAEKRLSYV